MFYSTKSNRNYNNHYFYCICCLKGLLWRVYNKFFNNLGIISGFGGVPSGIIDTRDGIIDTCGGIIGAREGIIGYNLSEKGGTLSTKQCNLVAKLQLIISSMCYML